MHATSPGETPARTPGPATHPRTSTPRTSSVSRLRRFVAAGAAALVVGACGGDGGRSEGQALVAELAPVPPSEVRGQATASSRQGAVKVSVAVLGLPGPSTLRISARAEPCPTEAPPPPGPDDEEGQTPRAAREAGAIAWTQVSTEGESGAGTLTFPAAELPEGGDVTILVRNVLGTPLACGRVTGLPVTEAPEGVEIPTSGKAAPPRTDSARPPTPPDSAAGGATPEGVSA